MYGLTPPIHISRNGRTIRNEQDWSKYETTATDVCGGDLTIALSRHSAALIFKTTLTPGGGNNRAEISYDTLRQK